jgi:RNA polymerase sigma factor (TIGR02999 family)
VTSSASAPEITALLVAWSEGDQAALDRLMPLVYGELRRIARRHMRSESKGHALQTTALVHEAYLRLIEQRSVTWRNRAHFFAIAAQAMRRILVSMARARHASKRSADLHPVVLSEAMTLSAERADELIALDDALVALSRLDPRRGRVVELRYFGGLSVEETGEVLGISAETVMRDWKRAKAWLLHQLDRSRPDALRA